MLERREIAAKDTDVVVIGSFLDPGSRRFRANLHCHSTHSDGGLCPDEIADMYIDEGYQILCIADHNSYADQDGDGVHDWNLDRVVMPPPRPRGEGRKPHLPCLEDAGREAYVRDYSRTATGQGRPWVEENWLLSREGELLVLPGFEDHFTGPHVVVNGYPTDVRGGDIARFKGTNGYREVAQQAGGVVYLAHPHAWDDQPGFFLDHPERRRFDGIEVVNSFLMRSGREADPAGEGGFARQLWDHILSAGVSCWGYGNDDMHNDDLSSHAGPFGAWTDVWAESLTADDVLRTLRTGSFSASTGVDVQSLTLEGVTVSVTTRNASRVRFVGRGGRTLAEADSSSAEYCIAGTEGYVRVECESDEKRWPDVQPDLGQWAFCQPLWVLAEGQPEPEGLPGPAGRAGGLSR